jgi:hypothetical protein
MARIALDHQKSDDPFYTAKLATARFYFARLLPEAEYHMKVIGAVLIMAASVAGAYSIEDGKLMHNLFMNTIFSKNYFFGLLFTIESLFQLSIYFSFATRTKLLPSSVKTSLASTISARSSRLIVYTIPSPRARSQ